MTMKKCKNYCGVECVNGNCPIALREEYEERCYPVVEDCGECHYYKGCEDCAFSGECKDKPIEVFDKQGEFTPEFKDLVDSYIKEEMQKVTTDGKFDVKKAMQYIKDVQEKTGISPYQIKRYKRKKRRLKKYERPV